MASRRRSGGRGGRRGYYWDGIQFPLTNVSSSSTALELVGPVAQEFMPATMVRIRGHLTFSNSGSDSATAGAELAAKIAYVELNDAGVITGDLAAIDTHEEDIAVRQLWTYYSRFQAAGANADAGDIDRVRIEIDVKVKIRLEASGKKSLWLFTDASPTNRMQVAGYLRCLLAHG